MKKSREGFIYKRKGSATIMALIFMLFLSIAGGAWVMMLAQENKVAASDEMEQKAWYAAEAGRKRAEAELSAKIEANENINAGWDWLAKDREVNETTDFIVLATGEALPNDGDIKSQVVKYGVYMGYEDNGQMIDITKEARTGTVTYQIYAVGVYGDMRKVIAATSKSVELNPPRRQSVDLDTLLSTAGGPSSDREHQIGGTGIRDWQNANDLSQYSGVTKEWYWAAQEVFVNEKMSHKLTNYECTIIFNSDDDKRKYYDLDNANGSWKAHAPDNLPDTETTDLWLKSATAFYPDGRMADIQMVTTNDTLSSNHTTTYTIAAIIVNGIVYARIGTSGAAKDLISPRFCIETGCDLQGSLAPVTLAINHLHTPSNTRTGMRTLFQGTPNERLETDDEWFVRQFMNNSLTYGTAHVDTSHTALPFKDYPTDVNNPVVSGAELPYGDGKFFERYAAARFQQVNYPD